MGEKRTIPYRIFRFFRLVYLKLFRINDTPQKIAIGLGIGVALGAFPGTGPVAALCLAFLLRVNRASALIGSLLTNTWISIPVFFLAVKTGAILTGLKYQDVRASWDIFIKDFRWEKVVSLSLQNVVIPTAVGYLIVSIWMGIISYIIVLVVISYSKRGRKP
ncbi:MAG: DUF2062 domain-containing protein [Candidatus Omnitrophica bacterium]|nr:DUF2062 domain-containing protein [Candidatus Omnitrophota bacterium]MCM8791494.1 DUF2062 domain-containing protein [Candidatus Omnitrophota bacterium]